MYDRAIKYLPLITILVFLLGYAFQDSYYKQFNIDILLYESNSEILYTLLPLSIFIFGGALGLISNNKRNNSNISIETQKPSPKKINGYFLIIIITMLLFVLQLVFRKFFDSFRIEPLIMLIGNIGLILTIGYKQITEIIRSKLITPNIFLVFTMLCGYLIIQYASSTAIVIKQLGSDREYTFYIKGKVIKTNRDYFVIGQTQGFVFLYNKLDSSTNIMTKTDLDSLKIIKVYN